MKIIHVRTPRTWTWAFSVHDWRLELQHHQETDRVLEPVQPGASCEGPNGESGGKAMGATRPWWEAYKTFPLPAGPCLCSNTSSVFAMDLHAWLWYSCLCLGLPCTACALFLSCFQPCLQPWTHVSLLLTSSCLLDFLVPDLWHGLDHKLAWSPGMHH